MTPNRLPTRRARQRVGAALCVLLASLHAGPQPLMAAAARTDDPPAGPAQGPTVDRSAALATASPDFREVVRTARARVFPAVVYLKCLRQGMESGRARTEEVGGSGVVISEEGELLTNWHVIDRAIEIRCLLSDGRAFRGELVASDRDLDLALVRIVLDAKHAPLPVAELGPSGELEEGDFVMAMGAPWGLNRSVSVGIVSCTRRFLPDSSEYSNWLQTDASISPGNSGGPLVDTRGRVVGINTLAQTAGGDLGFAIPSDTIREVLDRMRSSRDVGWSWTGLSLQPLRDFDRDVYFEEPTGSSSPASSPQAPPPQPASAAAIASARSVAWPSTASPARSCPPSADGSPSFRRACPSNSRSNARRPPAFRR